MPLGEEQILEQTSLSRLPKWEHGNGDLLPNPNQAPQDIFLTENFEKLWNTWFNKRAGYWQSGWLWKSETSLEI